MLIKSNLIKLLCTNVTKNENLIRNSTKQWNGLIISKRNIQKSSSLNAIHPLIWIIAKPLTKLGAIIAGRGFRKWWTALPNIKREIFWQHFKRNKHKYGIIFGSSGLITFTYYETHIQETPLTHRKRFILFDNNHLEEIERIEQEQLFELYESNFVNLYSPYSLRALRVANRLFSANKEINEIANIDWKLVLIDADAINAIAFPNGTLVVFTGLLDFVENDDELATILAHEMAHAILQHAAEELSHSRLVDVISIALTLMVWAFLPTDLTAALCHFFAERLLKLSLELPYSRELEKEADKVGLILTARACFDIRYSPGFWKRMSMLEELNMPEILSTHPTNETRAQDLESMVPEGLNLRKDCNCPDLPNFIEYKPVKHIPINVK